MSIKRRRNDHVAAWALGEKLGEGVARAVYVYRPNPQYVLKVEYDECGDFQNVAEWALWNGAPAAVRKWLAPCHSISADGRVLMQGRCTDVLDPAVIPRKVPGVLNDLHDDNWGWYDGRLVVRDYGRHLANTLGKNAGRALVPLHQRTRG